MNGRFIYLISVFGLILSGCGGDDSGQGTLPGDVSGSAAEERAAAVEDLRAEEEAAENLVFRPLDLPPADFSQAPMETEPNDGTDEATPMGPNHMARGTFPERERDYFSLTTEGEPQLWMIEASGPGIRTLEYQDISGGQRLNRRPLEGVATISNLYLPPGTHLFILWGDSASYTLRAVPLGPPDPAAELEPNDEESRAHILRIGRSRLGYLAEDNDEDWYRFSLKNPEHLRLVVAPPPDLGIRADLNEATKGILRIQGGEVGDSIIYETQLPVGDYYVRVTSERETVANLPYRIRLDRLDPFGVPGDIEPNDDVKWARPLPASMVVRGETGRWNDSRDYYRLPTQSEPARITLEPMELPEGRGLDRIVGVVNARDFRIVEWERNETDSTVVGEIPADTVAFLQVRDAGTYAFRVVLDPGPEVQPETTELGLEMLFPPGPHLFAAFWPKAQGTELPLQLRNTSDSEVSLTLSAASSDVNWQGRIPPGPVTLGPGEVQSIPVVVQVAQDAWGNYPVRLSVQASDGHGGTRSTFVDLIASCGAPPMNPRHPEPLPAELLGGLNVAWSALGAQVASEDPDRLRKEPTLLDGLTPANDIWNKSTGDLPWDLDVRLAGNEDLQVAGVVINPAGQEDLWTGVRDFELYLSRDGQSYNMALAGTLTRHPKDQAFLLPGAVPARFARLRILSPQGQSTQVTLSEWKVIAVPGSTPWEREGANIADPELGGYVVWSDPLVSEPRRQGLLTDEVEENDPRLDNLNPNEWVIGFQNDRAARIRRLEWVQPEGTSRPFMKDIHLSVSTGSPLGPWTPAGTLTVEPVGGASGFFEFPQPTWARYVKLSVTDVEEAQRYYIADVVRIFEAPVDGEYRSILGEWGKYQKASAFERLTAAGASANSRPEADNNDDRDHAQDLDLSTPYQGSVRVGEDVDWYEIRIPSSDNRLSLDLRGLPSLRAALTLEGGSGNSIPLTPTEEPDPGVHTLFEADVVGGETYWLRVEEPPRSIALAWDNSGSVTPFKNTLYPSLLNFSKDVMPGREFVNLLPFQDAPEFLLEEWSDQPYELQQALNDYDRDDGSSNAELNLKYATEQMMNREGTKAVVLLTDADSPGIRDSPQLWSALSTVRPSIFTVELHRGDARHHQDLMQSWASVNAGRYDYFQTGADLDVAFQRATCMIRRPARYEVLATTRHEDPPPPGFVEVSPGELTLNAVEIILDASGSMLQRMEGQRRIEIAREVISDLVQETIPEGTPLALRIFGHKTPDACDTDLEIPVSPLDRARVTQVIQRTEAMNLAKTPIGASLALVAEDLKDVTGQKLIMLVTDGEETCDGDPAGAIRALKEAGNDVRVNIVGFAIDDEGLKAQFENWAREGGGLYLNASGRDELADAVDRALRPKFQVLDQTGQILAEGTTGLDSIELPVGTYTVRILSSPQRTIRDVRVTSEQTTTVEMPT